MKILFDTSHPQQVYFFKNAAKILQNEGNEVFFTARDKEITLYLLELYGFDFIVVGTPQKGLLKKALNLLKIDYKMLNVMKKFKPDIVVSTGSMYAAHASAFRKIPHIAFETTDHAWIGHSLYVPFTPTVCSTITLRKDFGKKHIKYNSFDELAYLYPKYFRPDPSVLEELGLNKWDKFIIVRIGSWDAYHDLGKYGFSFKSDDELTQFIESLEKYCKVFLTTEKKVNSKFDKYILSTPPEKIHSILSYASLYVGEGATMAAESAVLGTPAVYVSTLSVGYIEELKNKYGLVTTCIGHQTALKNAIDIIENSKKEDWIKKREEVLKNKIDVTKFIADLIRDYPKSIENIKQRGGIVQ